MYVRAYPAIERVSMLGQMPSKGIGKDILVREPREHSELECTIGLG